MPPERLWIPRLALSRHNLAYFPSSALWRITAPYRGLFRTFSKRYGVQCAWVPLTVPAWHAAAFLCSHSARILCILYFAYRLFCIACTFLIILHFRSAQNIERPACRTARYFAIAVDHTPPSCRILWSHFCAIKTSQILSIAVCKNRHMPSWHSWHSN